MITRAECERMFREVVEACDPAVRVRAALDRSRLRPEVYGIAVGKAAQAMVRGAGPVTRGVCVSNFQRDALPAGWAFYPGAHPEPDDSSVRAADAVVDLVASTPAHAELLVLVSGGASAMIERPTIPLAQFRAEIAAVMASGADIREINRERIRRSQIKGGKLADICLAPIRTLIVSDVIGDPPGIIGSGPTFPERAPDTLEVVMPMKSAFDAWCWTQRTSETFRMFYPLEGEIDRVAEQLLSAEVRRVLGGGEPTLRVPERHGTGGRAQHLALLLARGLRDTQRSAFVVGTDGIDGPPRRGLDSPAGAYVDGRTWDRIRGAGIDPERALEHRDSTMALAAAGALVVTGPTGINHGDLVVIG